MRRLMLRQRRRNEMKKLGLAALVALSLAGTGIAQENAGNAEIRTDIVYGKNSVSIEKSVRGMTTIKDNNGASHNVETYSSITWWSYGKRGKNSEYAEQAGEHVVLVNVFPDFNIYTKVEMHDFNCDLRPDQISIMQSGQKTEYFDIKDMGRQDIMQSAKTFIDTKIELAKNVDFEKMFKEWERLKGENKVKKEKVM